MGFVLLLLYTLLYVLTGTGDGEEAGIGEVAVDGAEMVVLQDVAVGTGSGLEGAEAFGNSKDWADHLVPSLSFTGLLRGVGATSCLGRWLCWLPSLCLRSACLGSSTYQKFLPVLGLTFQPRFGKRGMGREVVSDELDVGGGRGVGGEGRVVVDAGAGLEVRDLVGPVTGVRAAFFSLATFTSCFSARRLAL